MKLFKVSVKKEDHYFASKSTAKRMRDMVNDDGRVATLHRGPDHWKGETFPGDGRTSKKWIRS